jgi:hypothetical protein
MVVGYPITDGDDLTQEEVNKNLKEFAKDVTVGTLLAISLYLVLKQAAYAADGKPSSPGPSPSKVSPPGSNTGILPAPPKSKSPERIISEEILVGIAAAICTAAAKSPVIWVTFGCVALVLISSSVSNSGN